MKRIAVIFEGRLHEQKGVFNAVINRVKHLRAIASHDIDVHMIEGYDRGLNRWLHGTRRITERPTLVAVDGVDIHVHWFCHSLADTVRHKMFHRPATTYLRWLSHLADDLKGYDLVSAHDRIAGRVAAMMSQRHSIPHYISWHGSSIHSDPARDAQYRQATIALLEGAQCNFFVSKGLEAHARQSLTERFAGEVLYNGVAPAFRRMDNATRQTLRARHGFDRSDRVVGFVGRMDAVKNVTLLDDIFDEISRQHDGPVRFVAIGDGPLRRQVESLMHERGIPCLMPGNVPSEQMPTWMNCLDVLVLPSRLEGLPLVALEAIQCGANVVGTDVMGIAEAIGRENIVPLDDDLAERMALRAVEMLKGGVTQSLPPDMSWDVTARKELTIYESAL